MSIKGGVIIQIPTSKTAPSTTL